MNLDSNRLAAELNEKCHCSAADIPALHSGIASVMPVMDEGSASTREHLFTAAPYFVTQQDAERMREVIAAVEHVVSLPGYRAEVLANAPAIAVHDPRTHGVLFGYDFHLSGEGPKLIEVNTNAGGALLNLELLRSQLQCCEAASYLTACGNYDVATQAIVDMFMAEWRCARGGESLRHVAIVDESPDQQYLYPEFMLFKRLFELRGIAASIVDPRVLRFDGQRLRVNDQPVDLVYNRLTDFYLAAEHLAELRKAYLANAAVITPHPLAHALYANKRNLILLSDARRLLELGADPTQVHVLTAFVPRAASIEPSHAAQWWQQRKEWFFKPVDGFGSRGVYRGDKLTRGVFQTIINGSYIAQRVSPPSERVIAEGGEPLKVDIRTYTYQGRVALLAARMYRGQTTNFRTPGGGFAPLFVLPHGPDGAQRDAWSQRRAQAARAQCSCESTRIRTNPSAIDTAPDCS